MKHDEIARQMVLVKAEADRGSGESGRLGDSTKELEWRRKVMVAATAFTAAVSDLINEVHEPVDREPQSGDQDSLYLSD